MRGAVLDEAYAARVYAGVLGKFIGVYLGRPVEGWPYETIQQQLGQLDRYVNDELGVPLVVADDDISGTLVFARAVQDAEGAPITPAAVGRTWLNYIIEDRTILWWGGYGRSTEHTAYLNLKRGVPAPESGSMERNGQTLAEQIGAQIFSDAFALMCPADPERAAQLTRTAASVSHDGVALDAAAYLAAMRADAFVEQDLDVLLERNRFVVTDARLLRLIDDVMSRVGRDDDWRSVRDWVDRHYGYARYPGPCHALSNIAMSIAALRLGGDDFARALMVAASVGFDTDSNAGTVGCLNGVRLGIAAIEAAPALRRPVADRALVVSSDGGECVSDAGIEARKIVDSARRLRGEGPEPERARFDFTLPGAVHGFEPCPFQSVPSRTPVRNLNDPTGPNALGVRVPADAEVAVSTPTFLDPRDAADNFSTLASPTLYPGDRVRVAVSATVPLEVRLYALYRDGELVHREDAIPCAVDAIPSQLEWEIPASGNLIPFRLGIAAVSGAEPGELRVHEVDWRGAPRDFRQNGILLSSIWDTKPQGLAIWVSSAKNFEADFASSYSVSHPDELGVVTTGGRSWRDYSAQSILSFSLHRAAGLVVRARGHRRFLAGVFVGGRVQLIEQHDGDRRVLSEAVFPYRLDARYEVRLDCVGDRLVLSVDGVLVLEAETARTDGGGAGFLIEGGTVTADGFRIRNLATERHHP